MEKPIDAQCKFSSFASLRPRWCVLLGAPGTRTVCVCSYHQNIELLLHAAGVNINYKELLRSAVCSMENEDCMFGRCFSCPGVESLRTLLGDNLRKVQAAETIKFKKVDLRKPHYTWNGGASIWRVCEPPHQAAAVSEAPSLRCQRTVEFFTEIEAEFTRKSSHLSNRFCWKLQLSCSRLSPVFLQEKKLKRPFTLYITRRKAKRKFGTKPSQ